MRSNNILYLKLVVFIFSFFLGCSSKVATQDVSFRVVPFSFTTDSGRYIMNGELKIPNNFAPLGKVVILVQPPLPIDKHYFGFFDSLAAFLLKKNIAVFRFDTRNYKYRFIDKHGLTMEEHAQDIEAAFRAITKISGFEKSKIGLIGHSEGGCSALISASNNNEISFCVLLSTISVPGDSFFLYQLGIQLDSTTVNQRTKNLLYDFSSGLVSVIKRYSSSEDLSDSLTKTIQSFLQKNPNLRLILRISLPLEIGIKDVVNEWNKPRKIAIINYDPHCYLVKIKSPMLFIYGSEDERLNADDNIENLRRILNSKNNNNFSIIKFVGLNHSYDSVYYRGYKKEPSGNIHKARSEVFNSITNWLSTLNLN